MYIVKDLNDYKLNSKQRVFVDFIQDKVGTYFSHEKIRNVKYIKQYVSPVNDFVIYNNTLPYTQVQRLKAYQKKAHI